MTPLLTSLAGRPMMLDVTGSDLRSHLAAVEARWAAAEPRVSADMAANEGFWPEAGSYAAQFRPYVVSDGVLQIPVKGVLLHDFPYTFFGMVTGYDYIGAAVARGVGDRSVQTIALMIDSPGGEVAGCFELSDAIFAARSSGKRVVAYVNDGAYSAAYATASAAHEIVVTRTGGVGSIGVVTYHIDASGAYEQMGIVKTYVFAGKHKVDGNETAPLSDETKARIEERLQVSYDTFVSTVARNRGMEAAAVRATEALTYTAPSAIEVGLADRIGTYSDAIWPPLADTSEGDSDMAEKQQATNEEKTVAQADGISPEQMAAAVSTARDEGMKAGAEAERARISAILGHSEAKDKPTAAHQAAFVLGLDAAKAIAFLAAMPSEKRETAKGAAFVERMNAEGSSGLGAIAEPVEADASKSRVERAFALRGK